MPMTVKQYALIRNQQTQRVSVKIFPNEESLLRHVNDHVLSEDEPWDRIFSRRLLSEMRKNLDDNNVVSCQMYEEIVGAVDAAIQYAIALPLYVWAKQHVEEETRERSSLYCISEHGLILVLDDVCLRTMYFCVSLGNNPSNYTAFNTAWKDIRRKLLRPKYDDSKMGRTIVALDCEWISPEHWEICPNPHLRPRPASRAQHQWRTTIRKYHGAVLDNEE